MKKGQKDGKVEYGQEGLTLERRSESSRGVIDLSMADLAIDDPAMAAIASNALTPGLPIVH